MLYNELNDGLILNSLTENNVEKKNETGNTPPALFSVENFKQDLKNKSSDSNLNFIEHSERLNAYDVVHSCIRTPIFRLLGTPLSDYSDNWLPVKLRSTFGTAFHEFLQNTYKDFTETEIYLRVPSLNISVKIDCLIGTDTLVEIKSCGYSDYAKILKSGRARSNDVNQALLYKYLLENYTQETKQQNVDLKKYSVPAHDSYNIKTIQMIYACHELFSSDYNSLDQAISESKELKKQLNSKYNYMWFLKVINYDLTSDNFSSHVNIINDKIKEANSYLTNKTIPPLTHKYVDKTKCFFCLYKNPCSKIP
jgi:hypothetical protein